MGDQAAKTIERTMLIGFQEDGAQEPTPVEGDSTVKAIKVLLHVWDPVELEWVKMTQP